MLCLLFRSCKTSARYAFPVSASRRQHQGQFEHRRTQVEPGAQGDGRDLHAAPCRLHQEKAEKAEQAANRNPVFPRRQQGEAGRSRRNDSEQPHPPGVLPPLDGNPPQQREQQTAPQKCTGHFFASVLHDNFTCFFT